MFRGIMLGLATTIGLGQSAVMTKESSGKDMVTTAVEAGSFKTLAAALKAAGLVETLPGKGSFTVFAPTDDAFAKLPKGTVQTLLKPENKSQLIAVLTYHVVAGKVVVAADVVKLNAAATVNGQRVDLKVDGNKVQAPQAEVVATYIACSNGVIHVIDQVLLPSTDDIPVTSAKADEFKTLLAAAKTTGVVDVLSGDQPLTAVAPTDEAFAKLPAGSVENLLKPENKAQLASILKDYVVAGRLFYSGLLAGVEAKSLQGSLLKAAVASGKASVNGSGLVAADIDASNAVIRVFDTVLLPPAAPAKGAIEPP